MRFSFLTLAGLCLSAALLQGCSDEPESTETAEKPVVTVYSERKEFLIKPMFDKFTAETGIGVRYITDGAGPLIARLVNEAEYTPADLLLTVDAGNLWQADQRGVLRSVDSEVLEANIPDKLQSANNTWFALTQRARTIVYSTERVAPEDLSTYEALAEPQWKGRLCLRTSKKVYNRSLVATMIKTLGTEKTEEIVRGWVDNLATDPYSNDTAVMESIVAGQCDVGLVNTYYFGRMEVVQPDIPLALFWPNQDGRGVHINISGAGVTKYAPHPEEALQLLEWLSSEEAQYEFAGLNQEYPANPKVPSSPEVASWGEFKADMVNVEAAGRLQDEAVKLMDRVGYR